MIPRDRSPDVDGVILDVGALEPDKPLADDERLEGGHSISLKRIACNLAEGDGLENSIQVHEVTARTALTDSQQLHGCNIHDTGHVTAIQSYRGLPKRRQGPHQQEPSACLLYTSDAADDLLCV